ncbi:MAG: CHASE2 domain-containing protein [Cyanobacteria bacterium P01_F01_bin.13]
MEEQSRWEKILDGFKTSLWGLGIIAAVLGARSLGVFHAVELVTLDRLSTLGAQLSEKTTDPNIIIIEIDPTYLEGSAEKGYTITANSLAEVLEAIFKHGPKVVGTDIVSYRITGDDQSKLQSTINRYSNLITVEETSSVNPAKPLPYFSDSQLAEQVGFNDFVVDRDGVVRRALLDFFPTRDDYKISFAIQVIKAYFKDQKINDEIIELENGTIDQGTMRFGEVEIPRIRATYGYPSDEIEGVQTLIKYKGGTTPFQTFSASDLLTLQSQPDEIIRDKIVILNLEGSADKYPIPLTTFGRVLDNSELVNGIEIQAHIISQIIQTVGHKRPLIRTNQSVQYGFLIVFSIIGIGCSRFSKDTLGSFASLLITLFSSILLSYLLLIQIGLWLPLAATLISTTANGLIYINYTQNKRRWEGMIAKLDLALENERQLSDELASQRQKTIEHMFDSIHNGPLQTLASLLRRTRDETINLPDICLGLEDLNREIRYIGDSIKQDASDKKDSLDVSYAGTKFDLDIPLQELFQEVYDAMLSRPFIGFSNLKFTIISFDSIESEILTVEVKRKLCRFLEEALANVGKHAVGATRLVVTGKNVDNFYELTVADNGPDFKPNKTETGEGTRIGWEVEKLTRGKFIHRANKPKGFFCQLTFPVST